jgi:hypothetical protein
VNGRRPLTATPAPKREIRFAPLSWKAPLLPPLLEGGSRTTSPRRPSRPVSEYGAAPALPSSRNQALGRGCLGRSTLVKTRRSPCPCSVCRGCPRRRGRGRRFLRWVARFQAWDSTVRAASCVRRRWRTWGTLGGSAALHLPACSQCHGGLVGCFPLQPMAPSTPTHKDHEKDVEAEA